MECPACGHPNREGARFCGQCAAALVRAATCPGCGAENPPGQRFCDACGHQLAAGTPPDAGPPAGFAGDRYRLIRKLGESARREVHLARDTRLERDVALSIVKTAGLDEIGVARARREARAMGRLGDHPHIVTVFDSGEENGRPYVVSQHMAGGTLADLLSRGGGRGLGVERTVRIADEIFQALEYAHRRGFVHRDLAPGSVWLTREGTARLGDFALASAAERDVRDPRSNLQGVGALLHELLTGRRPEHPPVPLSEQGLDVPEELDALVLDLLDPNPDRGPQNAAAAREALAGLLPRPARAAEPGREPSGADALGGVFVGREHEIRVLDRALDDAVAGRGRLVMLTGEPGIGKTRMADELAAHASERGVQVLWGRCYEGQGAPAYWPWVQVIRAYVWSREPADVAEAMGPGVADIAQLVSDVRERLGDVPAPPAVEADHARFRLFDAITTFLVNASRDEPIAVILDDLHWADKPSLLLLEFLVREAGSSRLLVLGTYRDVDLDLRHPLAALAADLRRDPAAEWVPLGGLSSSDVRTLLEATSEHELGGDAAAIADVVDRETEGNPFFIQEIVRHLVETGGVRHADRLPELGLPEGVREVIGRRLARLSDEAARVLTIGAVIGRDFGLDALERTVDLGTDRLLEALEDALGAHLIREVPERPGRYRFSHVLVRETIYEGLSGSRRVRLHRRVGEALEELYAESVEGHLTELAHHFREAARAGETARALEYATRAGDHAAEVLAYEEAALHYEHALEVADTPQRRCELLIALGEARSRAGDVASARESFGRAATLARELESAERLAAAALGFGAGLGGFGYTGRADEALINLLEEALAALPGGDSPLRVRLTSRLAVELYYTPQADRRAELARQAVAMAQRLSTRDAELVAQCSRHWSMLGPDGIEERIAGAWEVVRLADEVGDREMAFRGHHFRLCTLLELGDLQAVDREMAAATAIAEELRMPLYLWQATSFRAMRLLFEGRLGEGEKVAHEAFALGSRGHADIASVLFGVQLVYLRFLQGRMAELGEALTGFVERYPDSSFRPALAMCLAESGRHDEARAQLEVLSRDGFRRLHRDGNWIASMAPTCMAVSGLGDAPRAAALVELLDPYADRWVVGSAGAICMGPVSLYLGMAEAATGRRERAAARFEHAIAAGEQVRGRAAVVYARHEYGTLLLGSGDDAERRRGSEMLTEALAEARTLGLTRFSERILALDATTA